MKGIKNDDNCTIFQRWLVVCKLQKPEPEIRWMDLTEKPPARGRWERPAQTNKYTCHRFIIPWKENPSSLRIAEQPQFKPPALPPVAPWGTPSGSTNTPPSKTKNKYTPMKWMLLYYDYSNYVWTRLEKKLRKKKLKTNRKNKQVHSRRFGRFLLSLVLPPLIATTTTHPEYHHEISCKNAWRNTHLIVTV